MRDGKKRRRNWMCDTGRSGSRSSCEGRCLRTIAFESNHAKALSAAVKRHAGEAAVIQRCQVHKRRNVLDQLPEEYQPGMERKLIAAYAMTAEADARRALDQIHRDLERINPSAARSLEEGLEETLTVHKLRMPEMLRKSLASTNIVSFREACVTPCSLPC